MAFPTAERSTPYLSRAAGPLPKREPDGVLKGQLRGGVPASPVCAGPRSAGQSGRPQLRGDTPGSPPAALRGAAAGAPWPAVEPVRWSLCGRQLSARSLPCQSCEPLAAAVPAACTSLYGIGHPRRAAAAAGGGGGGRGQWGGEPAPPSASQAPAAAAERG